MGLIKNFLFFAAAMLGLVACSKETAGNIESEISGKTITLTASVNFGEPETKVAPNDTNSYGAGYNVAFHWQEGDQVLLVGDEESSTFTIVNSSISADGKTAQFTGTPLSDMSSYTAFYAGKNTDVATFAKVMSGSKSETTVALDNVEKGYNVVVVGTEGNTNGFTLDIFMNTFRLKLKGNVTLGKVEYLRDYDGTSETPLSVIKFGTDGLALTSTAQEVWIPVTDLPSSKVTFCFYDKGGNLIMNKRKTKDFSDAYTNYGNLISFPELEVAYEAKIGSTNYLTLADAITAANGMTDATIELLKNVTVNDATLSISKSMTIDMDGYSITCTKSTQSEITFPFLVETGGISLTFKNGVILDGAEDDNNRFDNFIAGASAGSFSISATYTLNLTNVDFGVFDASDNCTAKFYTKGNNTLFSGIANATFTNARVGTTFSVIYNDNYGTNNITVKGGKYVINGNNTKANSAFHFENGTNVFDAVTIDFTSDYSGSSCVCGPATLKNCNFTSNQYAVRSAGEYSITIDGGTYNGAVAAVQVTQGTVTINSGTFTSAGNVLQTDGCYESGGEYNAKIYVNDGQFKGAIKKKANDEYNTIELKGGIYSAEPTIDCIASGYALELNDDATTKATYPYKVIEGGGSVGGGLGDIGKTDGTW